MTLNYRIIVERWCSNRNGVVGGSIPDREIISLLDVKLAR